MCVALVVRDRADGITLDQCDAHGLPPKVRYTRIKGILTIELRVKSHSIEFWRGRVQLMKAKGAPWRRVHSLGTVFDQEGHILIDGWYDELLLPDEDVLYLH